jgi:uncharacterized DUF497 family protein
MLEFSWSSDKNELLINKRSVSFEQIIYQIEQGYLLDIIEHPNKEKYANQKMFIVEFNNYVYQVPFIDLDDKVFLKTIIPNRKATKKYLK